MCSSGRDSCEIDALALPAMPSHDSLGDLRVEHVFDVPLREVSGICLRRGDSHRMSLIAVGDRAAKIAWLALPPEDLQSPPWQEIDVAGFASSQLPQDDPQIEAICADGAGGVLLLQESPPRIELLDLETSKAVACMELVVEGDNDLARSWSHPKGSRGEGVALLPDGHLLVAKEKEPAALIEFGPAGSRPQGLACGGVLRDGERWRYTPSCTRLVALASWLPDEKLARTCLDFSDLEVGPDGLLYLLSDQSAAIARLDDLKVGGGAARLTASWSLGSLKGKPEGLAFTPDGRAVVALDKRKRRRNLFVLQPAIATSGPGAK